MKHLIIVLLIILGNTFSLSAQETFKSLSDTKGVEVVYISETMINIAGSFGVKGIPMPSLTKTKVKNMEIYSAETPAASQAAVQAYTNYKKAHPDLQILVKVKEDSEITEISAIPSPTPNIFTTLLIYNSDKKETSIIVINGRFSNDDIVSLSRGRY